MVIRQSCFSFFRLYPWTHDCERFSRGGRVTAGCVDASTQWHSTGLRTGAGAATASAEAAPAQGFTAMLQSRDVGGQLAQPLPFRTALQPSPLLPAREDAAALENAAAFTPDARTVWPGVPLPSRGDTGTPSEAAGGSNEGPTSGGDQSLNNDSHEQAESACGSKGKRTKEEVQRRNKEVRLLTQLIRGTFGDDL